MIPTRLGWTAVGLVAGALLSSGCGDDGNPTMETGADDGAATSTAGASADGSGSAGSTSAAQTGCDELPRLRVINDTGNAVEEVSVLACDMTEEFSYPVPLGALPDGGELTIDLPGPGCWILGYNGEGCFPEMPGTVDVAACETVEWQLSADEHVCSGG